MDGQCGPPVSDPVTALVRNPKIIAERSMNYDGRVGRYHAPPYFGYRYSVKSTQIIEKIYFLNLQVNL